MDGYDVIGDVHGHAERLGGLLRKLGYREQQGAWRHPSRRAVFVGDLIDRGPAQRDSVRIPSAMVEAGSAQIVLGNHEFNAIAYSTWNDERGDCCRPRTGPRGAKHLEQHQAFVSEIGLDNNEHRDILDWFRTIPVWLDLGDLRVIHACWNQRHIDHLTGLINESGGVTEDIIRDGTKPGHPTHDAIETLIKGPEIDLDGQTYLDKGGHPRKHARRRWWDAGARTLRSAALIPGGTTGLDGQPFPELPDTPLLDAEQHSYTSSVPVIVGHYWETGTPTVLGPNAACVDYSAGKGGPLVAYRWSGESDLSSNNFVSY